MEKLSFHHLLYLSFKKAYYIYKMKHPLVFICAVIFLMSCSLSEIQAQPYSIGIQKVIGGPEQEVALSRWAKGGGFFWLAIHSYSDVGFDKTVALCPDTLPRNDIWLLKLDSNLTILDQWNLGGSNYEEVLDVHFDDTNNWLYVVGESSSEPSCNKTDTLFGDQDIWIVKVDTQGNIIWDYSYGGRKMDRVQTSLLLKNGNLVISVFSLTDTISGTITTPPPNIYDNAFLMCINGNGAILWQNWVTDDNRIEIKKIIEKSNGNLVINGYISGNDSPGGYLTQFPHPGADEDGWIAELDATGNHLWDRVIGSTGFEVLFNIYALNNKLYAFGRLQNSANAYEVNDTLRGGSDLYIVEMDSTGNYIRDVIIGGIGSEVLIDVALKSDSSGFLLLSISNSGISFDKTTPGYGFNDTWIVELDTALNKVYDYSIGTSLNDYYSNWLVDGNSVYLACLLEPNATGMNTVSTYNSENDIWAIKLGPGITGLSDNSYAPGWNLISNTIQNLLEIKNALRNESWSILDVTGKLIQSGINPNTTEMLNIPLHNLSSGMYIFKMGKKAEKFMVVEK